MLVTDAEPDRFAPLAPPAPLALRGVWVVRRAVGQPLADAFDSNTACAPTSMGTTGIRIACRAYARSSYDALTFSASSVHVERWRGALDDLFRDHDLLDAFGRAQPALRIRAYPRKQAMQSCPLAISTLWGMLRLYWVTSRRNAVWFSLPTISRAT